LAPQGALLIFTMLIIKVMLYEVQTIYDDNTKVNELLYSEKGYSINPKQQNIKQCYVNMFKYKYEGHMFPALVTISNKKYIVPTWQEVQLQTTLDDIDWIKPQSKKLDIVKFEVIGSNGDKYNTVFNPNTKKWKCSCPGSWRAKDGICKHIKSKLELSNH
jgi:hypothetical protein